MSSVPLPAGVSPELLERLLDLIGTDGQLQEKDIMEGCAVSRPVTRAATAVLLDRGQLEVVPQGGPVRYRRPVPIDPVLVRSDLMAGILQAVSTEAQTVRTLAGRFGIDVAAMHATVRSMHQEGVLSVTMVGATWVCRPA